MHMCPATLADIVNISITIQITMRIFHKSKIMLDEQSVEDPEIKVTMTYPLDMVCEVCQRGAVWCTFAWMGGASHTRSRTAGICPRKR